MKFVYSALQLWIPAIVGNPNVFGFCKERMMFWDSLNGILYLNKKKYVALKGSAFEKPDTDTLVDVLRTID
jgi:hypothetical protein